MQISGYVFRCCLRLAIAFVLSTGLSSQAAELPAEKLAAIKRAIVFVQVEGRERQSGAGFVCGKLGDQILIATAGHPVVPGRIPRVTGIKAVFYPGTAEEQILGAKILVLDPPRDV